MLPTNAEGADELSVRPSSADDEGYRSILERLTDSDRYFRFFHAVSELGPSERRVGNVGDEVVGFVAEDHGEPIGAAHAVVGADGTAELAIEVVPTGRHHGVGTRLVGIVAAELRRRGVRELVAYALAGNSAFAEMAHTCGMHAGEIEDGVVTWRLPLGEVPAP